MNRLRNIQRLPRFQGPPKWVPILGDLQKTLHKGEHLPLRPLPMFESNFVQVTNQGAPVYLHHRTSRLTMGVAASLPGLVLPDILLLAQPPEGRGSSGLHLTRLIPLDLAHLYVHDLPTWRLKLRLATGRYYYLELDAPCDERGFLFDRWIRLIDLLRQPAPAWAPRALPKSPLGLDLVAPPASTWRLQVGPDPAESTVMSAKVTFPYEVVTSRKQKKAKALKRRFKSQAAGDSEAGGRRKSKEQKSLPGPTLDPSHKEIQVSEKPSLVIRTIFSIISSIKSQEHSSPQASCRRGLGAGSDVFSADTYNRTEGHRCQEDTEALVDPLSSTMSSHSVCPDAPHAAFHRSATPASLPRPRGKARPPRPQKAPPVPHISWKAPFIPDQSPKAPRAPAPHHRVPVLLAPYQKTPPIPAPSQRAPPVPAPSQRVPAVPAPSHRAPPVPALPRKSTSLTLPKRKSLFLPAPSPKALSSEPQQQRVFPPPAPLEKTPTSPGTLLSEDMLEGSKPKEKPVLMAGAQEEAVVELRARAVSLEVPFSKTKKESKEVLISKTREITLEGLTGRRKVEDRAHKTKEEISLDLPGGKSREVGWQKRWVKTHALTLEGPSREKFQPFSVEGLALAKLMLIASSKGSHLRPPAVALPSWLSLTSQVSTVSKVDSVPFNPSQVCWLERTPVEVREQPESSTGIKKSTRQWRHAEEAPWDPTEHAKPSCHPSPPSSSPRMESGPRPPIALPATRWEHVEESPISPPPSRMDVTARMPQRPPRISEEPGKHSLATMSSSSSMLSPMLVQIESLKDVNPDMGAAREEVGILTAASRYLGARGGLPGNEWPRSVEQGVQPEESQAGWIVENLESGNAKEFGCE
ncbi:protein FAM71E2 [Choloepus didactylus]|uniref:protein FAM71E2 n=1 Tax=Choloepus didactylus TaxID=27675 RepID=UPI00189E0F05|nr:protein FAM71E2 [Choloepus didactylus]